MMHAHISDILTFVYLLTPGWTEELAIVEMMINYKQMVLSYNEFRCHTLQDIYMCINRVRETLRVNKFMQVQ